MTSNSMLAYGAEFDFGLYELTPCIRYMLAALPRSGSTFFSHTLWETGLLGAPLEYLNPSMNVEIRKRLGADNDSTVYWAKLQQCRTSPNGAFGWKIFMSNYLTICKQEPGFVNRLAADKVIFLTRRDKFAQAVSTVLAIQTKSWFSDIGRINQPYFSKQQIEDMIITILIQEKFFEDLFVKAEADVYRVYYEDLKKNPDKITNDILKWLNVQKEFDVDHRKPVKTPEIAPSRLNLTQDWSTKFVDEYFRGRSFTSSFPELLSQSPGPDVSARC